MQRTEMVALVAGTTVGLGGGTLGAFLVCTIVVHRFLDQFDDQYVDLGQPARPTARQSAQQASLGGASVTQPQRASDQPPRAALIV
jgi:hypothetical protein